MRQTLAQHYGTKPVGLGGTFLLEQGNAKLHVMVSIKVSQLHVRQLDILMIRASALHPVGRGLDHGQLIPETCKGRFVASLFGGRHRDWNRSEVHMKI